MAMATSCHEGCPYDFALELGRAVLTPGELCEARVRVKRLSIPTEGEGAAEDKRVGAADNAGDPSSSPRGSDDPGSVSRNEVWFDLCCYERVDPGLVEVRARDYDSGGAAGKTRKKVERVIGRSERVRHGLRISPSDPEAWFSVLIEVPEGSPPTYTGASVTYAYKLRVGAGRAVPSKKAASGFREVEKASTTFPLCFWPSQSRAGQWRQDWAQHEDGSVPFGLRVAEIADDASGLGSGFTEGSRKPSVSASAAPAGDHHPDLPSPGSSLRDYAMPDFMRYGRRSSRSGAELEDLEILSPRERESSYNIYCGEVCLVRLHVLGDLDAQPGDLIECVLDFLPSAGASCAKVSVELCSEETVLRPRQGNKARVKSSRQAYCDEEAVLHSARTSFTLSVPRESPPSFESDLVKLEWELRFAFDVLTGPSGAKGQLNWKLPVRLSLKH